MNRELQDPIITKIMADGYYYDQEPAHVCSCCQEAIWDDEFWEINGGDVCSECIKRIAEEEITENVERAASFVGAERRTQ